MRGRHGSREGGSLGAQASGGEGEIRWDSLEEEEEGRSVGKWQAGGRRGQGLGAGVDGTWQHRWRDQPR